MSDLLAPDERGLACPAGGFHVDPWRPVPVAVVTHAHADHARPGSGRYYATAASLPLLKRRLGPDADVVGLEAHESVRLGETRVSLHPAGHVLGSAQARVEGPDETWVVSGDYKLDPDPTCAPFEAVPCDVFVTESTFALPIYRWDPPERTGRELARWWESCRDDGRPALLFAYALGKAQRLLAMLGADRVWTHGAVETIVEAYREAGVDLPPTRRVADAPASERFAGELVLAPPSAHRSPWMRRFRGASTAFASGWMRVRGARRRVGYERGFALSDHADWRGLLAAVRATGARRVLATHGYADVLARHLAQTGLETGIVETRYEGEREAEA
ncbi:MAG TPA: ligase-associated DNA damage response exonuclease [Candidatus Thermoplasmatota archaeon]|nr:ligase-associated DNA damage response exonuclease [Candidatus Thermoplasmatota archaeon]